MSSHSGSGRATVVVGDSVDGMESSSRSQNWCRTFELATRSGKRPLRILVDSGSTGNYIGAQECPKRNLEVEKDGTSEELRIPYGYIVKT